MKHYEEDTNLRTTLLVNLSESMQFGSGARRSPHGLATKYDYSCTTATTLADLLLRQQDIRMPCISISGNLSEQP